MEGAGESYGRLVKVNNRNSQDFGDYDEDMTGCTPFFFNLFCMTNFFLLVLRNRKAKKPKGEGLKKARYSTDINTHNAH